MSCCSTELGTDRKIDFDYSSSSEMLVVALVVVAIVATTGLLSWSGVTVLPAYLETSMGLPHGVYDVRDLLMLRSAVARGDIDLISVVTEAGSDYDRLIEIIRRTSPASRMGQ